LSYGRNFRFPNDRLGSFDSGGERGIRTLGEAFVPHTRL